MNVVNRETRPQKCQAKFKNELVRRDASLGIRGSNIPVMTFTSNRRRAPAVAPRYLFSKGTTRAHNTSMGPPKASPRSLKRNSTRPESLSSAYGHHVLASDSAALSSQDVTTPRNRPAALRYISSSSRGGYSGNRSARSTSTSFVEPSVILAISEGRGMARGEIGMAALDLKHPHLVLCQFSDTLLYTHTLTKINYFNPVEILVPHTLYEGGKSSQLGQLVREQRPHCTVTAVQRRHFNDEAARRQIQSLCAPQYSAVQLQVLHKFYALTAAAAVLKYVENIQCIVFARESLKIEYHSSENTMIIDVGTATQLELVQPLVPSAGPTCCLLGVLGPTYTMGGIRALRAALLQPSCNRDFIEARLDTVQELIENETGLMMDLQNVLKKLSEVDKILFLCIETPNTNMDKYGETQITQTILLKTTMDLVPSLVEALKEVESARLRKIKTELENPIYKEITHRIRSIIQDDAHHERGVVGSLQRCFAVKPEINGLLDVARRMYSELIEDIQRMVEQLSEAYDLPLRMNQNVMKGFHIVLPVAPKNRRHFNVKDLPPIFIQVVFSGASVTMSTEDLVVLDHQAKEALNEIQKMTNIVISTLLKELRPFMSSLYKLCDNVAELDILLALAQISSIGAYIRPDFNSYMEVRNSVHPLLDYNSRTSPVPNDIFATPEHNFTIITGPNMGGKSVYIKQIAILQIMAQLGCFVPATSAVFRLSDRIFSRVGFNDSVELNASTYVLEMKEIQHILQGLTPTSLVIIDELCRGTSVEEGTSVSWAICEELLSSDAFTFFTTHFIYLTRLQELYFNVLNRHAVVTEQDSENTQNLQKRLSYQHKIEPGITNIRNYGLALAAVTNFPEETVNFAKELAEVINENSQTQKIATPLRTDEALLYKLNADIKLASRKDVDSDAQIRKIKEQFKKEHPQLIERLLAEKRKNTKSTDAEKSSEINNLTENTSKMFADISDISIEAETAAQKSPIHNYSKVTQITEEIFVSSPNPTTNHNLNDYEVPIYNDKYTSVTFSTDLLNTFTSIEKSTHGQDRITDVVLNEENSVLLNSNSHECNSSNVNDNMIDISPNRNNIISEMFKEADNTRNNKEHLNVDDFHNVGELSASNSDHNADLSNDNNGHIDLSNNDSIDIRSNKSGRSIMELSGTSDELTQIIAYDDSFVKSKTISIDMSSPDEELMIETVNEINDELMVSNIENLILTPPCDFRD